MSVGGREALSDVWEWLGVPPRCSGGVERPSRMFGRGMEALWNVREY